MPRRSTPGAAPAPRTILEKYQEFCSRWAQGCGAAECGRARMIVFYTGDLPCDVLLVGEAPGKSEDSLGGPFQGPAGTLLRAIVRKGLEGGRAGALGVGYTNIVACIPRDEDGRKAGPPSDEQVLSCQPRLAQIVELSSPRLIVLVGKQAEDWVDFGPPYHGYRHALRLPAEVSHVGIMHPAAILKANEAHQGLLIQRCVVTLQNAFMDLMEAPARPAGA